MSSSAPQSGPTVGLVLGGGGLVGGAWILGGLLALADTTRWDPRTADYIVGTSAGSVLGALIDAGLSPEEIKSALGGESRQARGLGRFRLKRALPLPMPASPRLALQAIRGGGEAGPLARLAAWLPSGFLCTEPITELVAELAPRGWAKSSRLRVVAYELDSGKRVVFRRGGAPAAGLADAVAASCAIPGVYHPVVLHGRRYIDGGVHSPSNADVLSRRRPGVVICLNPLSSSGAVAGGSWFDRLAESIRGISGSYLERETQLLKSGGSEVLVLQPSATDVNLMGFNLMRSDGLDDIVQAARTSVAAQLRQVTAASGAASTPRVARLFGLRQLPRRAPTSAPRKPIEPSIPRISAGTVAA